MRYKRLQVKRALKTWKKQKTKKKMMKATTFFGSDIVRRHVQYLNTRSPVLPDFGHGLHRFFEVLGTTELCAEERKRERACALIVLAEPLQERFYAMRTN